MHSVALTHTVKRSDLAALTPRQLYDGLKLKARDPREFVTAIESCEVLSESETGLLRVVKFKGKPESVQERVEFFPPITATFEMLSPTGETTARIMNIISTTPDGDVLLTFTFAFGKSGAEDTGTEADEWVKGIVAQGNETIDRSIIVIRELVKQGKI